MKKIKKSEIIVSNFNELFAVILEVLIQCNDTQIFISNVLFNKLLRQNRKSIIWGEYVQDDFCSCNEVGISFIFNIEINNRASTFQMNFYEVCKDYICITFFSSKGIIYRSYLTEIKEILIISSD